MLLIFCDTCLIEKALPEIFPKFPIQSQYEFLYINIIGNTNHFRCVRIDIQKFNRLIIGLY